MAITKNKLLRFIGISLLVIGTMLYANAIYLIGTDLSQPSWATFGKFVAAVILAYCGYNTCFEKGRR